MPFRPLCQFSAGLMLLLATVLVFAPGLLFTVFGLEVTPFGAFVSKRAAMFMLGFATLYWLAREATGETRRIVAAASVVTLAGMAATGLYEVLRGYAGPGIFLAIGIESLLSVGFARYLRG